MTVTLHILNESTGAAKDLDLHGARLKAALATMPGIDAEMLAGATYVVHPAARTGNAVSADRMVLQTHGAVRKGRRT